MVTGEAEKVEVGVMGLQAGAMAPGSDVVDSRGLFHPHMDRHVGLGEQGGSELMEGSQHTPTPGIPGPSRSRLCWLLCCKYGSILMPLFLPSGPFSVTSLSPAKCPLLWDVPHIPWWPYSIPVSHSTEVLEAHPQHLAWGLWIK